jgi:hypothetical protein
MVVEEAAEHPIPVGKPVEHGEEPTVGVLAAAAALGDDAWRRCPALSGA